MLGMPINLLAQLAEKFLPATPTCVSTPNCTILKFATSAVEFLFQKISCVITYMRNIQDKQDTLKRS